MCGISGYFSRREKYIDTESLLNSMKNQSYRGPDSNGIWNNDFCGLGHVRLSILDLSMEAGQPMHFAEGNLHISYNGEIYNYKTLREKLVKKGYHFTTESDTEVLIKGYHYFGSRFFEEVNGMFSIAIYDDLKNELFLCRDRFAIKPLYYYVDDEKCFFSSELGGLMAFPLQRKLDQNSLLNYLQFSYIPDSKSILEGIQQLDPGSYIIVKSAKVQKARYYTLEEKNSEISLEEALLGIKERCRKSIDRRLISDVPIATFLSSGIDSSIITYLSSKLSPGIKAFSAGFSDHPYFDESKLAKEWGQDLQIDHSIIDLKEDALLNEADAILNAYSEPFADSSAIAFSLLSKKVSKERSVVLSGDGADELFGGYRKHKAEYLYRKYPRLTRAFSSILSLSLKNEGGRDGTIANTKRQLKKWLNASSLSNEERYLFWASIADRKEADSLLFNDTYNEYSFDNKLRNLNDVMLRDFNQVLSGDMLYKVDRSSMQFGLEVRVPFLDHELVDFVFSLPSEWKLKGGERKYLLKESFKNEIPVSIRNRRKKGFEVPLSAWLRGPLKSKVDRLLNKEQIMDMSLFNFEEVQQIIQRSRSSDPGNSPQLLWSLLVFQQWMINYKPVY